RIRQGGQFHAKLLPLKSDIKGGMLVYKTKLLFILNSRPPKKTITSLVNCFFRMPEMLGLRTKKPYGVDALQWFGGLLRSTQICKVLLVKVHLKKIYLVKVHLKKIYAILEIFLNYISEILLSLFRDAFFQIGFATFIFHISIDEERCYGLLNFVDSWAACHLHPLYFSALFFQVTFLHNTLHANHLNQVEYT
ncbi:hypothetical protein ACJX0J_041303, partial [Zea mays]